MSVCRHELWDSTPPQLTPPGNSNPGIISTRHLIPASVALSLVGGATVVRVSHSSAVVASIVPRQNCRHALRPLLSTPPRNLGKIDRVVQKK